MKMEAGRYEVSTDKREGMKLKVISFANLLLQKSYFRYIIRGEGSKAMARLF